MAIFHFVTHLESPVSGHIRISRPKIVQLSPSKRDREAEIGNTLCCNLLVISFLFPETWPSCLGKYFMNQLDSAESKRFLGHGQSPLFCPRFNYWLQKDQKVASVTASPPFFSTETRIATNEASSMHKDTTWNLRQLRQLIVSQATPCAWETLPSQGAPKNGNPSPFFLKLLQFDV